MPIRTTVLLNIRPEIAEALLSENMSAEERFQNITISPILKLQHELLIDVFKNYIAKHKNVFYELSLPKQLDYIENAIHKDMKFRNSLKGMIIGQFTIEEYSAYTQNSSALNKRIMNMVKASFIDHLQVFMPNLAKAI